MYQLTNTYFVSNPSQPIDGVKKIDGNITTYIPFSEDNTDYQAYLKWLAEGNTPLPADE